MAIFPPATSLLAPPSAVHSNGAAVSANVPVISSEYPLSRLVDGSLSQPCRFAFGTLTITITTASVTPNIFGVLNHNIDPGRVIGITNNAGLNRGFSVRDPNCWIDLRGFPTTATTWVLAISSNSVPISIGEIVIATGTEFNGTIAAPFTEDIVYPGYRDRTEYHKLYLSASGAMIRRLPLGLRITRTQWAALDTMWDEVGTTDGRMVVVPSTRVNDIWFAEWPNRSEFTFPNVAETTVPLDLVEESGGVLAGR